MKLLFILIILRICTLNLLSQTTQEFLETSVKEEQKNGAISIIMKANICSACIGNNIYEGFIFIKKSNDIYEVRYLKYINRPASVKLLEDYTITDSNIKEIFEITDKYQDSITKQLRNIDSLLQVKIVKDGIVLYREPLNHGKMLFVKYYNNTTSASSIYSVTNVNSIFEKAYYFWLLISSVNNYNDSYKIQNCKD